MKDHRYPAHAASVRLAFAGAAFAAAAVVVGALVAAFGSASSEPFVRDSPAARVAAASCDARPGRTARRDCRQQVLAAAKARDAGATQVAAADAP